MITQPVRLPAIMKPMYLCLKKRGFTLIELVTTIIVVGIIAIPLSITISQQIQSVANSGDYNTALNLARFEIEKVNNLNYTNINSATFSNYQGYPYDVNRIVSYAQGNGTSNESLKQVTVEVNKSGNATVLVRLITYIAKNIGFGL